jgi:Na+/melibiose symporter-like transporter
LQSTVRRRALRLGYLQGALWSAGNGLTSGSLITYLALDLGASGFDVGAILALQQATGLLRVFAPSLIAWFGSARRACLGLTLLSYVLLCVLPILTLASEPLNAVMPSIEVLHRIAPVHKMVALLCVHQLLENLGVVALWAWWADLVPVQIRGRYFGRRNLFQLAVLIPTTFASGWFIDHWRGTHPDALLVGYAWITGLGVLLLLGSLVPLWFMPEHAGPAMTNPPRVDRQHHSWWETFDALRSDKSLRWMILFGAWFSLANGLTQTAQNVYPKVTLGIPLFAQQLMIATMRFGQAGYGLVAGNYSDRLGNVPVLAVSQLLQAAGLLFFFFATPVQPYWVVGAWLLWSSFAGINLCAPNLLLRLGQSSTAAYMGVYLGVSGMAYALGTLASGWLFDWLKLATGGAPFGPWRLDFVHYLFLGGWLARSLAVLFLRPIQEPRHR